VLVRLGRATNSSETAIIVIKVYKSISLLLLYN
jgi:hypothetical protein